MINRLIKSFVFDESSRSGLVFSDPAKIRLNAEDAREPRLELKSQTGGFPIATDIFVETPLITAEALTRWLAFEAVKPDDTSPPGTSVSFKVKTTTGPYFWNGAAWVPAGPSDWSSEAELNANLASFPLSAIGSKAIGFAVNLRTANAAVTPRVKALKLLGEFDIEFLEDIIYDGVIRTLNTEFRSTSLLVFPTSGSIQDIDLSAVLENKAYNITSIRKVINLTDDPLRLENLFLAYAPGASRQDGFTTDPGNVSLTATVPGGKLLEVTFEYVPEFIVKTGQDFFEVPAFPAVVFESIRDDTRGGFTMRDTNAMGRELIRNLDALTGVLQYGPTQKTLRFDYAVFTNLQVDQMRLAGDLAQFFSRTKQIRSHGLGEEYDLLFLQELDTARSKARLEAGGQGDHTDTTIATGAFELLGVLFYHKPSIDVALVADGGIRLTSGSS